MKRIIFFVCALAVFSSAYAKKDGVYTKQFSAKEIRAGQKWAKKGEWRNGFTANPHSSVNLAEFKEQYEKNREQWDAAFRWLATHDLLAIEKGKYKIEGTSLEVKVEDSKNEPLEKRKSESHREIIDFQFCVKGTERFGILDHNTSKPDGDYKPDVQRYTYEKEKTLFLDSNPGEFFLFFPDDWHIAKVANDGEDQTIRVIVIKIDYIRQTQNLPELPPMPEVPEPLKENMIRLDDNKTFEDVKLDIPITTGPFEASWESIENHYPGEPEWLREAKIGFWVHFGPQAAGESGDWYARNLYKQGHKAYENHVRRYGHPTEVGYKDVLKEWNPDKLDPVRLTALYKKAGARFLMIQGVHHDNYDLWNSKYQPWNSVNVGPKRDLLREWADACKRQGMHYGVTFHHEYTWWWWQTAFQSDTKGDKAGQQYDGRLTLEDGKGKWWEGFDPRMLYGVNLREYESVAPNANTGWSPPKDGIFWRHLDYAKWYATQWALRMMDVTANYDPDFIYTDGTMEGPFCGTGTGTGYKCNAMPLVMADYYNRQLKSRGKVDGFSIIKFRHPTNGAVNTAEFDFPDIINTSQPWIREAPVGDWFYAPGFTYDSGSMIRFIIEAICRDGNVALNIPMRPDGSIEEACEKMLEEVGAWLKVNGQAVYGSKAWTTLGEGEIVDGKLKKLPGGGLGKTQAEFRFSPQDIRFTVGKDGALYAFLMALPAAGETITIKSLCTSAKKVQNVSLLGSKSKIKWQQTADGLTLTAPAKLPCQTAVVFKIN